MKLSVEVDSKIAEERFQSVLRDFQRQAKLPGFREGKAPADIIEKRYTKEVEEEVLKELVPEMYQQAVVQHSVQPVTLPTISAIDWQRGKKLTFQAEFERGPEFSFKNYKGIKIKKVSSEVSESDLEKGIVALLESHAELVPIVGSRPVQKGDFIVTDVEVAKNGQYVPGKKGVLLVAEPSKTDDFFDQVVGAKVDDVREISVEVSEEDKKNGLVGRKPFYKVSIRGIREKKVPALTEEFVKNFGKNSVEDFRDAMRKDLAQHKRGEAHEKMKVELFDKLLGMVSFSIPEGLVEKQKQHLIEQAKKEYERMGLSADRFESQKVEIELDAATKAKNQVKLYFILQRVSEQEGIEPDELEIEKRLQALAEQSKRPLDEVKRVFEEDLRESMREAKTIDFLLANAKLEESEDK